MKNKEEKHYETLIQNEQKGEIYSVKLKGDPVIYTAIPMIQARYQNQSIQKFTMKILEPENRKGIYEGLVDDIQSIKSTN